MTSVRRQFKTSQGSEKGRKKKAPNPAGQSLTYKAKGRNSESRTQDSKAATQTAELWRISRPCPPLEKQLSVLFRKDSLGEHLYKAHTPSH